MKKTGGQQELVEGAIPELKDNVDEVVEKLDRIYSLHEDAKVFRKLSKEVKETIKGFVLGLSEEDQAIGRVKVGGYELPFSVTEEKETPVSFTRGGKKKVSLKLAPEDEDEE